VQSQGIKALFVFVVAIMVGSLSFLLRNRQDETITCVADLPSNL